MNRLLGPLGLALALTGCATTKPHPPTPPTDDKDYSALEEALGEAAEAQIVALFRVANDPAAINRLRQAARQLLPVTTRGQIAYSFHVLDTKEKNALSLSNGRILFTRGLLEMLADEEVTAVVAHEMAHINHKHLLTEFHRMERTLWQRIFLAGTLELIPLAGSKLRYLLLDRGFDHRQELEADRTGADYLQDAGLDPEALVRVIEKFERDPDLRKQRSFLATHPGEKTRVERLRAHLQETATNRSHP